MNIAELKNSGSIIFECIGGSRLYGLATEASDIDIRGVFILPIDLFYSFEYQGQIDDERSNVVYYELRKFLDLLAKNNPNLLELLNIPAENILYKHPLYDSIKAQDFISRLCKDTFAGYAMSQIKKAHGLNKKILNPIPKEKKSLLEFCYVLKTQGSMPFMEFLQGKGLLADKCGLAAIDHMKELYHVFYSPQGFYQGIIQNKNSMEVSLSSIPKGEKPIATLYFNKSGYISYCKDYTEYWHWVENRNENRYQSTLEHGKNYDAKNMMHAFRLLAMAEDIGRSGTICVRSPEREFLLKIRQGAFSYKELLEMAYQKILKIKELFDNCALPSEPNIKLINQLLIDMRKNFYHLK